VRPNDPQQLRSFLITPADLFQTAAHLPSLPSRAHHYARLMAALDQIELGHREQEVLQAIKQLSDSTEQH
jgi:hypothetical protein